MDYQDLNNARAFPQKQIEASARKLLKSLTAKTETASKGQWFLDEAKAKTEEANSNQFKQHLYRFHYAIIRQAYVWQVMLMGIAIGNLSRDLNDFEARASEAAKLFAEFERLFKELKAIYSVANSDPYV